MAEKSENSIGGLRARLAKAKATAMRIKERGDEVMGIAFGALEVSFVAGIFGALEGYTGGETQLFGLPGELAAAFAGHAYGILSGTRHNEHVHNLANGALAVAAYKAGKKLGEKAKKNKTEKGSIFGAEGEYSQLPQGQRIYGGTSNAIIAAGVLPSLCLNRLA